MGDALLRALVARSAAATGRPDPLSGRPVTRLEVTTQRDRIDVAVLVNEDVFVIIEDKVHTSEHGDQIERYLEQVRERHPSTSDRIVLPVFVKTGNASPSCMKLSTACGVFLRHDLLALLDAHSDTGDEIVRQFRAHQGALEAETRSYLTLPPRDWSWTAMEGFYIQLCDWLVNAFGRGEIPANPDPDWGWVSNQKGGFAGCWWGWSRLPDPACTLYLQINEVNELHVRATNDDQGVGRETEIRRDQLYDALHKLESAVVPSGAKGLRVVKAGRFRGGHSGACAKLVFDGGADDSVWIATGAQGLMDWPETQARLETAMALVHAACGATLTTTRSDDE